MSELPKHRASNGGTSFQVDDSPDQQPPSPSTTSDVELKSFPSHEAADETALRPISRSHHLHPSHPSPARWCLHVQAMFWRALMSCSMFLHDWTPSPPPAPAFTRSIPAQQDRPGSPLVTLHFYVPSDYSSRIRDGHRYPVVINFHGGGFCLGNATNDRYWANVVLKSAHAVFVSIDYRRAPEFPYPTAVDDGVDALVYLAANADSLGLDATRFALSGFSAGANLAFSVPLRLNFHTRRDPMSTESPDFGRQPSTGKLLESASPNSLRIVDIVAFYPLLDWSISRDAKRRRSRRPEKTLPKFLADLFDYSYLPPADTKLHASPFVSPGLAPNHMLIHGLPGDIQIFLCEWDMLLEEGERFAHRLQGLGKNVRSTLIPEVVHGWDKHPDPWRDQGSIDALYEKACEGLRQSFGIDNDEGDDEDQ